MFLKRGGRISRAKVDWDLPLDSRLDLLDRSHSEAAGRDCSSDWLCPLGPPCLQLGPNKKG